MVTPEEAKQNNRVGIDTRAAAAAESIIDKRLAAYDGGSPIRIDNSALPVSVQVRRAVAQLYRQHWHVEEVNGSEHGVPDFLQFSENAGGPFD